jgi:hypothetical protein
MIGRPVKTGGYSCEVPEGLTYAPGGYFGRTEVLGQFDSV